jgi:hypothetical protein
VVDLDFPVRWQLISGGNGVFDPRLGDVFKQTSGPYLGSLFLYMLRDTSISIPVNPVTEGCSAESCISYLLPGGIGNVQPWPTFETLETKAATNYVVQRAPGYQLDFWEPQADISWSTGSCRIYGTNSSALQLCMQTAGSYASTGELISGESSACC